MPRKVRLNPVPSPVVEMDNYRWRTWFSELRSRIGEGPLQIQGYSENDLPPANEWGSVNADDGFSSLIFVYDIPAVAYSNGTDWINITTGAAI